MFTTFNSVLNVAIEVAAFLPLLMFIHYTFMSCAKKNQIATVQEPEVITEPVQAVTESREETMPEISDEEYQEALKELREDLGYLLEEMPEYTMTLQWDEVIEEEDKTRKALESKTRKQLIQDLNSRGITGYSKWNKAQMIEALI
jgi:glutamyl/glutaminyl-tRNA synthetase